MGRKGGPVSKHVKVLEITKLWSWVPKPRMTVLARASSNFSDRPMLNEFYRTIFKHLSFLKIPPDVNRAALLEILVVKSKS
jgi:hypothetical protein